MTTPLNPDRQHALDWLRVIAFGLLILYHVGMYYVADWGWHIKSTYLSEPLQYVMLWLNQWRMSLLFLISGYAVALLLRKRSPGAFILDRHQRLLIPLAFGMLVVVVPQVFAEARAIGLIGPDYGFFTFWGDYLNQRSALFSAHKTLGSMHLTWNHLWYLPYIFAYSLAAAAAYYLCPEKIRHACFQWLTHKPAWQLALALPILALTLNGQWLYEHFPPTNAFFNDYFNHGRYGIAFAMGMLMMRLPHLWLWLTSIRQLTLAAAVMSYGVVVLDFSGSLPEHTADSGLLTLVWSCNKWLWLITVCGWAQHCLNRENPIVRYLNQGVYCYYVLHQTLIISLALCLAPYELGPRLEPLLLVVLTVIGCFAGYEILRNIPVLRWCVGIHQKPARKNSLKRSFVMSAQANASTNVLERKNP